MCLGRVVTPLGRSRQTRPRSEGRTHFEAGRGIGEEAAIAAYSQPILPITVVVSYVCDL
jgi:hypothetical protein